VTWRDANEGTVRLRRDGRREARVLMTSSSRLCALPPEIELGALDLRLAADAALDHRPSPAGGAGHWARPHRLLHSRAEHGGHVANRGAGESGPLLRRQAGRPPLPFGGARGRPAGGPFTFAGAMPERLRQYPDGRSGSTGSHSRWGQSANVASPRRRTGDLARIAQAIGVGLALLPNDVVDGLRARILDCWCCKPQGLMARRPGAGLLGPPDRVGSDDAATC
jgi:hypothetical protein